MSLEQNKFDGIVEAKRQVADKLLELNIQISGIGVGFGARGYEVAVRLVREMSGVEKAAAPTEWNGYPVSYKVTGIAIVFAGG